MTKEEGELCCSPGAENLSETRRTHGSEVSAGGSFVIKREQEKEQRALEPLRKVFDGAGITWPHEK